MRLALYQPDIPQNVGAIMRLCACLGVKLDIILPCGFILDDARIRRAGMDYIDHLIWQKHATWSEFQAHKPGRTVLLTTRGATSLYDFAFAPTDTLVMGRESAGVPEEVHEAVDGRVIIPLQPGLRSLNVATAAALALGEALRQTSTYMSRNQD